MLIAQFTVRTARLARVGELCTLIGWSISSSGRKHEAARRCSLRVASFAPGRGRYG
jgi:hypothetical protein